MPRPAPKPKEPTVPLSQLFRYATVTDRLLLGIACAAALINGTVLPLFTVVFGELLDALQGPDFIDTVNRLSLYFLLIAIGVGVTSFLEVALPVYTAEKQLVRIRLAYLRALLAQEMGFHDTNAGGEVTSRLSEDTVTMGRGMGEKLTSTVRQTATLVAGIAIGFATSWKLTLVIMACSPFFAIALAILIITTLRAEKDTAAAYASAGDAAGEVLSLIRSVAAYGGERHETRRYESHVVRALKAGVKKGIFTGMAVGVMVSTLYLQYGISTYSGATFVISDRENKAGCALNPFDSANCFTGGLVVRTFTAVLLGASSLGSLGPAFGTIAAARAAGYKIFQVIDRKPKIDAAAPGGKKPSPVRGAIEFKDVTFTYPSRDIPVLRNFSLSIAPGETVALVGESGSGKSTIVALILRYYDPDSGAVLIDGVDVREWDVTYLRDCMGVVQQDPLLFGTSIAANIAMGRAASLQPTTTATTKDVDVAVATTKVAVGGAEVSVDADVVEAARAANAHHFICDLPEGYHTLAGTSVSAVQLSGGQRQRICIARAIIRQPRVLLLDEATSALDNASERVVQAALDKLMKAANDAGAQRTSVVIAHRLSTIQNADRIVVLSKGAIVEAGSHSELMAREGGAYRHLRSLQEVAGAQESRLSQAATSRAEELAATAGGAADGGSGGATAGATAGATGKDLATVTNPLHSKASKDGSTSGSSSGDDTAELPPVSNWRLWRMQSSDWPMMVVGVVGAAASGCVQPVFAIIYGDMIALYFKDTDTMVSEALKFLGWFALMGAAAFFGVLARVGVFTWLGERLTRKLRVMSYEAILRQPMSFFDHPRNSVGRLSARLSADAALVKGASGDVLGTIVEGCGAIVAAVAIAFSGSWRLALVLLAVFPLLVIGSLYEFKGVSGQSRISNKGLESSGDIASEAVTAIRTVAAFNLQDRTVQAFAATLEGPLRAGITRGRTQGSGQAFSQTILIATYSLAFWAGSRFIAEGWLSFNDLLRVFLAVTLASNAVGRISASAPDTAKADSAKRQIFALLDSVPTAIDPLQGGGVVIPKDEFKGRVEFKSVTFAYPQRPDRPVLRNFSLAIEPGETVALVGESGSGKSTIVALILRYYDVQPGQGEVLVDGHNVKTLNLAWLRSQFAVVAQEPALFADSVEYNIKYGVADSAKMEPGQGALPAESSGAAAATGAGAAAVTGAAGGEADAADKEGQKKSDAVVVPVKPTAAHNSGSGSGSGKDSGEHKAWPAPAAEVVAAAQAANAYDFVSSFPDGFATYCGSRGSQLSGGQKQRVAIARAIIRNPKILLLDEATSALSSQDEQVVQASLDKLMRHDSSNGSSSSSEATQRSTIVIAHRLSTIQNADRIVVMSKGVVVEAGSHSELMEVGGAYVQLVQAQAATH